MEAGKSIEEIEKLIITAVDFCKSINISISSKFDQIKISKLSEKSTKLENGYTLISYYASPNSAFISDNNKCSILESLLLYLQPKCDLKKWKYDYYKEILNVDKSWLDSFQVGFDNWEEFNITDFNQEAYDLGKKIKLYVTRK